MTIYTPKIQKAIQFAIQTHEIDQKQKRKGKDIAYIIHPLTVGLILARAGASEDVIVAGILHDTIEDSLEQHKVTAETVEKLFGKEVATYVLSVTETNKALPWEERKEHALAHIATLSEGSLLIKSADILVNGTELLDDHAQHGDAVFKRFNAPSKELLIKNQLRLITAIIKKWADNPLAQDLKFLAYSLFGICELAFMMAEPARSIPHREYDENAVISCPVCLWQGMGRDALSESGHVCVELRCPICDKMIIVAEFAMLNKAL